MPDVHYESLKEYMDVINRRLQELDEKLRLQAKYFAELYELSDDAVKQAASLITKTQARKVDLESYKPRAIFLSQQEPGP